MGMVLLRNHNEQSALNTNRIATIPAVLEREQGRANSSSLIPILSPGNLANSTGADQNISKPRQGQRTSRSVSSPLPGKRTAKKSRRLLLYLAFIGGVIAAACLAGGYYEITNLQPRRQNSSAVMQLDLRYQCCRWTK